MNAERIEAILDSCEQALEAGRPIDLKALQFWQAVSAVKRNPEWIARYADRIAAIDRRAFEQRISLRFPVAVGAAALTLGSVVGLLLVAISSATSASWRGLPLLAGTVAILVTTHDLAHLLVGKAIGLRFSHWYLGGPIPFEPGLKIDYASYLRTPPRARAWMHASGALTSKVVPFAGLAAGAAMKAPAWASAILLVVGIVQIVIDVVFSTRYSDWKRFRREIRIAREQEAK